MSTIHWISAVFSAIGGVLSSMVMIQAGYFTDEHPAVASDVYASAYYSVNCMVELFFALFILLFIVSVVGILTSGKRDTRNHRERSAD